MAHYETQQQNPMQNPQFNPQLWSQFYPQSSQQPGGLFGAPWTQGAGYGLGQAAYGQQFGQFGGQPYGQQSFGGFGYNPGWGAQPQWWGQQQPQWGGMQHRHLSQQDVSEVVRQLLPALPQILAQAQQPHAALGYAAYGQAPRTLTQQDVNEVVRQILPMVPQIAGMLQGQPHGQYASMYGGAGTWGQWPSHLAPNIAAQNPFATWPQQQPFGQYGQQHGWPQFQSAFGSPSAFGQPQRQLTQHDIAEVTRQLVGLIPQVINNLQAYNQPRMA